MAVDVSPSQAHTFPLVALLVLLFHRVIDKLKEEEEAEEAQGNDAVEKKLSAHEVMLFRHKTQNVSVPVAGTVRQRLVMLTKAFREARLTEEGLNVENN
jgi:hypothetical protein